MRSQVSVLVFAALLLVGGCGKGNFSQSNEKAKENVFRYSIVQKPTTLDPGKVEDGNTIDIIQQVYEGLTAWSPENVPVPNLAEKWEVSADGTTYTFTIKKGVKFHSGRELKAQDFKYSIERAADPALSSPTVLSYLDDIVGLKERVAGKAKEVSGVKVVDDYTLEIKIDKARPYFLGKLTYPVSFAVDKDVAKMGVEITTLDAMKSGTGPYIPKSYEAEQVFVMEANKNYHGGAPKIDRIERLVVTDSATRIAKYKSGDLDLIQLARQDIASIESDPKYKAELKFYDRPAIWYVGFNERMVPALADPKVRRAIGMAINRKRIVEDLMGNFNKLATGILPPGVDGAREGVLPYDFDPASAKALLKESGWEGKMPSIDMYFRSEEADYRLVTEAVQSDLKQNLGVTINVKPLASPAYFNRFNKKQIPMYHMRWAADYLDPQNFISIFFMKDGGQNKFYYENKNVDALCNQADIEKDHEKRMALYHQAEDIILNDVAWIPLFYQRDAELVNPRIQGMRESLFGHLPHTTVSVTK
ncbi:MAG: peptide ABC transporter substrate-binding protein [Fimbriimonadaceae bacterium]|nr:peptide ABC transporter substrate-binding protein [Fimbriimonadaceae bacterium]